MNGDGTELPPKECYVIVRDLSENETKREIIIYVWDTFSVAVIGQYVKKPSVTTSMAIGGGVTTSASTWTVEPMFSSSKGYYYDNPSITSILLLQPGHWFVIGEEAYYIKSGTGTAREVTKYPVTKPVRRIGNNLNKIVWSVNPSAYPENGEKNEIWYVKRTRN